MKNEEGMKGRRLLTSSYRDFHPCDLGDRYVSFLLKNECTERVLQQHVLLDHLAVIRKLYRTGGGTGGGDDEGWEPSLSSMRIMEDLNLGISTSITAAAPGANGAIDQGGEGQRGSNPKKKGVGGAGGSIEIDAFQLLSLEPILGNLTLRYPDTLLELLEDSTVQARTVLRRRMEVALHSALEARKKTQDSLDNQNNIDEAIERETNNMTQLLKALRYTKEWYEPRPLHARLVHLPPHMQCCKPTLSSISSADVGTVVQICGTVVRTGPVRMMETMRTYMCLGKGCGMKFSLHADFGTTNNALPQPIVCPSYSSDEEGTCNSTSFAIVPDGSEHTDYQEIKLQESASALNRVGSIPRSILIKLADDLVDMCNPGDEVVVVGCLHAEWQNHSLGASVEVMVGMSMRAHSVRVINVEEGSAGAGVGGGGGAMADLALVGAAASSGNLREKFRREFDALWSDVGAKQHPIATRDYIVRAVCPKLYGMHAVKLGLLLVLIGGALVTSSREGDVDGAPEDDNSELVEEQSEAPMAFKIGGGADDDDGYVENIKKKRAKDGQSKANNRTREVRRRVQSHILLLGDPGTGKSQFLRFAAALSPRSVLTTGTGSSTAGLTCAAVRDSSTAGSNGSEFSLEAGALALADRGVCCIDEFGCMSKQDRTSIHEAMEQQTISVAKAGIVCKLNARATVVAVMNPTGGIYDETLNLEQNSRLGSALLSRFDLIFVMLDQAQQERDENIATFLLQQSIIPGSGYDRPQAIGALFNDDKTNGHWSMEKLRAYIATIREMFHPTLSPEASELLENHYSSCRQLRNGQSLITVRFLESLIRLSQAHARLMYRNVVTLDDAVAVILLMECTAVASSGGMFGPGNNDYQFDDCLQKNPIDTDFKPFEKADSLFEIEKQILLRRYDGKNSNNNRSSPPTFDSYRRCWDGISQNEVDHRPSFASNRQIRNDLRDQWGRQMLSQNTSPHSQPISQHDPSHRTIETMSQNSSSDYRKPSSNRVTFSQQIQSTFPENRDDPIMTIDDTRYQSTERLDNGMTRHGNLGDPPGQYSAQVTQIGGILRDPSETNIRPPSQHHSSSGQKRKRQRTAD
ncbi:hypothetical protein ACHAXH_006670 [Discostella pseudostelligera]